MALAEAIQTYRFAGLEKSFATALNAALVRFRGVSTFHPFISDR
ncbi:hypothetical protein [Brevibacterium luteolum]|nr:hypothetical protein [Brevibacterium luteolum]